MSRSRRSGIAAGVCYLITHVTSIAAVVLYGPVLTRRDWIVEAGPATRVLLGALLETVLVVAIVGTAAFLYPVVRRASESLAVGYVALRTLEAGVIAVGIVSLLAVVSLSRQTPTASSGSMEALGRALVAVHDRTFLLGPDFLCAADTAVLAWLLLRSRLVARFIPVTGLVGAPVLLASGAAVLFGAYSQVSAVAALTALPVFAWEVSLALWLIVRGFGDDAMTPGSIDTLESTGIHLAVA